MSEVEYQNLVMKARAILEQIREFPAREMLDYENKHGFKACEAIKMWSVQLEIQD